MLKRFKNWLRHAYWQRFVPKDAPQTPHFDPPTTAVFFDRLDRAKSYLEFGSGGSTIEADRRSLPTLSVENDRFYAKAVKSGLSDGSAVTMKIVDIGLIGKWGRPLFRKATPARLRRWSRYYREPFKMAQTTNGFPDFILIDGRFRSACFLESLRCAHMAGVDEMTILFDDYYRQRKSGYSQVEKFAGAPQRNGRSALWTLQPNRLEKVPTEADVAAAGADFD